MGVTIVKKNNLMQLKGLLFYLNTYVLTKKALPTLQMGMVWPENKQLLPQRDAECLMITKNNVNVCYNSKKT